MKLPINIVKLGGRFEIGPFDLELVTLAHSIPEPSAVVIRTQHGTVFHTGDWKLDADPLVGKGSDDNRLQELGAEGIDVVVCDSTNAMRQGRSPSEVEVAASITKIIKGAKRRVAVTTFASNVARVKAVADAAAASGRKLVISGRAMHRVIRVAKDTGYLPEDLSDARPAGSSDLSTRTRCCCWPPAARARRGQRWRGSRRTSTRRSRSARAIS